MRTYKITVYYSNEAKVPEDLNCPPEGSFTATRQLGNLGFFRIYVSVVGMEPQEPDSYLSLSWSHAESALETISNVVEFLTKQGRREDAAR